MATVKSKKVGESLEQIKESIRDSYEYHKPNIDRYNEFNKFVFESSMTQDDIALYYELGKPQLEFNILEAYISRLRGEFARQEPSLNVIPASDANKVDPQLLKILDGHVRAILFDSNTDNMEFDVYTDTLGGGFSAIKVWTDWMNEMSFDQQICIGRVYDPTLCGWDKLARKSHKGDGRYCFELFPQSKKEFEEQYGNKYTDSMKFTRAIEEFNWSYSNGTEEVVLVGEFYEKKKKAGKIVQLVTGQSMTVEDYEQFIANWNARTDLMVQAPGVIGKARNTEFITICRYRIIENAILEYIETDFKYLPIIFVDGNSRMIRGSKTEAARQLCRPYVYHAKGVQKLKNFAGVTLANELENLVQSKFIVAKESIDPSYSAAWTNIQKASTLVYNAFKDMDGQIPLPPPMPVPRPPAPPEIAQTFTMSDEITQAILGSYDAALGINDKDLSGKAIINGATQSNAAAKPFIVNYMKALNQVGRIVLDLIPKYYLAPRSIKTKDIAGKSGYAQVNYTNTPKMTYMPEMLDIRIEAGVAFEIQQQQALASLINLMQVNPTFAQFMMGEQGLETLLDNLNIRGIDAIKQGVSQFVQQNQQMQSQAQQAQMQQMQAPLMMKQAELQQKAQKDQMDYQIKAKQTEIAEQDAETRRLVGLAQIGEKADKIELEQAKLEAEDARTKVASINAVANIADVSHKHAMDILDLHHTNERHARELDHAKELARTARDVISS
jgi:hypothetical protein